MTTTTSISITVDEAFTAFVSDFKRNKYADLGRYEPFLDSSTDVEQLEARVAEYMLTTQGGVAR